MKFDIEVLRKYESEGWIYSHRHSTDNLIIWNYSQFTQYENHWDNITLQCRGLVTDSNGNVISKYFDKFFNYHENKTILETNKPVTLYEKVDGSFIGIFYYQDKWYVHSKGSFVSEQAIKASEIFFEKIQHSKWFDSEKSKFYCYVFELITPENRIVVDYGNISELVHLATFDPFINFNETKKYAQDLDVFRKPETIYMNKLDHEYLLKNQKENFEGYVIEDIFGTRVKFKFDEYVRLHRIITNITSYDIYECILDQPKFLQLLDEVPDEFYNWVHEVASKILSNLIEKIVEIYSQFEDIKYKLNCEYGENLWTSKELSFSIKDNPNKFYFFILWNNRELQSEEIEKRLESQILKRLKPDYEKPPATKYGN